MPIDDGGSWGIDDAVAALTRVVGAGRARMVDVGSTPWTHRRAMARGRVVLGDATRATLGAAGTGSLPGVTGTWSELFEAARVAGIQAAKQTSALVPLCHTLPSTGVTVQLFPGAGAVTVEGRAEVVGPAGVDMEALVACVVAGLTVVAALVAVDPDISMEDVALWEKSGGRSGTWRR